MSQHNGSAENLGIPLAQFGIADQYDREGRRRKVVQMFENLYTVVACQVAAKPDAVDVDQCESVFFTGFVKEYVARVHVEVEHSLFVHFDDESREILQNFAGFFISFRRVLSNGWAMNSERKYPVWNRP